MNALITWLSKMLSEADGTPSSKRFVFVFGTGFAGGVVVTLACTIAYKATGTELVGMFSYVYNGFLMAVTGGYVGGKLADGRAPGATPP
jgi:hypothetical protein